VSTLVQTLVAPPPPFRVLYADSFVGTIETVLGAEVSKSGATWTLLSEPNPTEGTLDGVELSKISRKSLPEIGKATFRYVYGKYPTEVVAAPPSLLNKEVRLQLQDEAGTWHTVFWGHVDYEENESLVGSPSGTSQGARIYFCLDGFARTQKWPMNRHGFDPLKDGTAGRRQDDAYGNPGYNYYLAADGPLIGNKGSYTYTLDGVTIKTHIWQGAFSASINDTTYVWAEYEAVNHAVSATKPIGEPWFHLKEGFANYSSFSPLMVAPNDKVFNFVARVCGRQRGLGTVAVKWKDVAGGDYGQIYVWLGVTPLNTTSIPFDYIVSGAGGQVDGAQSYTDWGTSRNLSYKNVGNDYLDLRGDHRTRDDQFFFGTMEGQQFDYIETIGENIEVAFEMSLGDTDGGIANIFDPTKLISCGPRWSETDRDTFEGLSMNARVMTRWNHVYQAFGLPRWWQGFAGDAIGTAGNIIRIDVRCKDDGSIFIPDNTNFPKDTAGSSCELLSYLPFYDGFKYDGANPIRTDNSPSNGMPDRRGVTCYMRLTETTDDRWFLPQGQLPSNLTDKFNFRAAIGGFNPSVSVGPDSVQVISQYFTEVGKRVIADTSREEALSANYKLGALYDVTKLAITIAVRLPYPLRFCSTSDSVPEVYARPLTTYPTTGFKDWQKAKRKKQIKVPRAHLWLAHGSCIWDLQQTSVTEDGFLAYRNPLTIPSDSVGTIRDDRDRVQFYHMVAQNWYLNLRRRLGFTQSYCGLIPFTKLVAGVPTVDYPVQINDHIEKSYQNGDTDVAASIVGTNVTSVDYDHQAQTTTWGTDYFDLEFDV